MAEGVRSDGIRVERLLGIAKAGAALDNPTIPTMVCDKAVTMVRAGLLSPGEAQALLKGLRSAPLDDLIPQTKVQRLEDAIFIANSEDSDVGVMCEEQLRRGRWRIERPHFRGRSIVMTAPEAGVIAMYRGFEELRPLIEKVLADGPRDATFGPATQSLLAGMDIGVAESEGRLVELVRDVMLGDSEVLRRYTLRWGIEELMWQSAARIVRRSGSERARLTAAMNESRRDAQTGPSGSHRYEPDAVFTRALSETIGATVRGSARHVQLVLKDESWKTRSLEDVQR